MAICLGTIGEKKVRRRKNIQLSESPTDEKSLSLHIDMDMYHNSIKIILNRKVGGT